MSAPASPFVMDEVEALQAPPPSKRARISAEVQKEGAWKIVNLDCPTFRELMLILKETLPVAHFEVRTTPQFTGLCVNAMHSSTALIIKARFQCPITASSDVDGDRFCVDTKQFSATLKQIKPDVSQVSLELDHETNKLKLCAVGKTRDTFELDTLDVEPTACEMKNLQMRYAVDIELEAFFGFCRNALASGAALINIVMKEPKTQAASGERITFVTLTAKGDSMKHEREFFSGTRQEEKDVSTGKQFSIRAIESTKETWGKEYGELVTLFDRKFGLKFMELLLKNMDSDKIRLNMSPEPGMPLIVCYNLGGAAAYNMGGSASFIHTLLAPAVSEDDQ